MLQTWTDEDKRCNLRSFFHPVQEEKPNTFDPETFLWGSNVLLWISAEVSGLVCRDETGDPEVTTAFDLPDAVVNFEVSTASFNIYTAYREEASNIQKLFGIQLISGHRPYALQSSRQRASFVPTLHRLDRKPRCVGECPGACGQCGFSLGSIEVLEGWQSCRC